MKILKITAITIILISGMAIIGCDDGSTNKDITAKNITLVCLGDSLTAGYGATASFEEDKSKSYPAYLQKKANISVINAGVSGDTTAQALVRVDSDVLSEDPKIVIILLGANDFFDFLHFPVSETKKNLQSIIKKVDNRKRKSIWQNFIRMRWQRHLVTFCLSLSLPLLLIYMLVNIIICIRRLQSPII